MIVVPKACTAQDSEREKHSKQGIVTEVYYSLAITLGRTLNLKTSFSEIREYCHKYIAFEP